jgi:hypothetical protein
VIVAVPVVGVVEVTVDDVVGVVAVRDHLVTTVGAVCVILAVVGAGVGRSAVGGVLGVDGENVLVNVVAVDVMEVAVVEKVFVAIVLDRLVSAVGPVRVVVVFVCLVLGAHDFFSFFSCLGGLGFVFVFVFVFGLRSSVSSSSVRTIKVSDRFARPYSS